MLLFSHSLKNLKSESGSVMSDSLWPHGPCSPWNSPGQNTGVGSWSLLQGIFPSQGLNTGYRWILYQLSHLGSSLWVFTHNLIWPARLLCPWNSPGKNTGVGCYFLPQGIFLTQGSNVSPMSPSLAGRFFTTGAPGKSHKRTHTV